MQFTAEEREIIDKLLEESDEEQRKNGNKLYSHEEVWRSILGREKYEVIHRI